jgi:hypothetical protein
MASLFVLFFWFSLFVGQLEDHASQHEFDQRNQRFARGDDELEIELSRAEGHESSSRSTRKEDPT